MIQLCLASYEEEKQMYAYRNPKHRDTSSRKQSTNTLDACFSTLFCRRNNVENLLLVVDVGLDTANIGLASIVLSLVSV